MFRKAHFSNSAYFSYLNFSCFCLICTSCFVNTQENEAKKVIMLRISQGSSSKLYCFGCLILIFEVL